MSSQAAVAASMMGHQTQTQTRLAAERDALALSLPSHGHPLDTTDPGAFLASHSTQQDLLAHLALPTMPSGREEGGTNANSLKDLLDRLRPMAGEQKQQTSGTNEFTSAADHPTPERPLISPIDSSFPDSRPPSTTFPDTYHEVVVDTPEVVDAVQIEGGLPFLPENMLGLSNALEGPDPAHADLLANFGTSGVVPSRPALDPSRRNVDSFHRDAANELGEPTKDHLQRVHEAGRIEAFAKIDFADGYFYMTTSSLELGRDELAYKAAQEKAKEVELALRQRPASSSGQASHGPEKLRRAAGSQVQGSVVSERGGFCGVDPKNAEENQSRHAAESQSHSSQLSASSVVKMEDLELHPPPPPARVDYQKRVDEASKIEAKVATDDEQPAPVTAAHLPRLDSNPLIPIHPTTDDLNLEIEAHKSISRRHARIAWDDAQQCFMLEVLGRNGAFLGDDYMNAGSSAPLRPDAVIQIAGIQMYFRLPTIHVNSSDESDGEEEELSPRVPNQSTTPTSDEIGRSASPSGRNLAKSGPNYKTIKKSAPLVTPVPLIGPDGQPLPPKKRGPGRPPKDGIMSNRERREIAKAEKMRAAKEANGGVTPPLSGRGSINRLSFAEIHADQPKSEKRKYTKRKRAGGELDGDVVPSIEGGQVEGVSDDEVKVSKKSRASRSPSPIYPPKEELTEEQMAKPQDNYARLIYDILNDIHPNELGLRSIYRKLKIKFPYFVHKVSTEGWQSSVRHNLNSEYGKLFEKGRKDGKGWAWRAIPGKFTESKEDVAKKRKAQEAAQAEAKAKAANKPQFHSGPPQWQQPGAPFQHPSGMPGNGNFPPFYMPNASFMPPPNGMQWPPAQGGPVMPPQQHPQNPRMMPVNQQGTPYPPPHMQNGQYRGPPPPPPTQQPLRPTQPPSGPASQQAPRHSSSSSHPPGQPPARPASSMAPSLPSNMICTVKGLEAIERFQKVLLSDTREEEQERTKTLFQSARRRVLHGVADSIMPEGDQDSTEEGELIKWIEEIVELNKNPNYVKPVNNTPTPTTNSVMDAPGEMSGILRETPDWVMVNEQTVTGGQEKTTETSEATDVSGVMSGSE